MLIIHSHVVLLDTLSLEHLARGVAHHSLRGLVSVVISHLDFAYMEVQDDVLVAEARLEHNIVRHEVPVRIEL